MGSILGLTVIFSQNLVKEIESFRKGPGGITDNSDEVHLLALFLRYSNAFFKGQL